MTQIRPATSCIAAVETNSSLASLHALEARIECQRDALLKLTAEPLNDFDDLEAALARIVEVSAATLNVHRVSIWQLDASRTAIECLDQYEAGTDRHSAGMVLAAADYPNYFRSIDETDIVAADDAIGDVRTAEFTDDYLRPQGIVSMMDVPLHLNGQVVGILCHEHVGERRAWAADERSFAIAVSNLISLAFERCERLRAESASCLQVAALNAAADAIVIADLDARIVWVNPAFTALTGYVEAEAIGRSPRELLYSGRQDSAFYERMWSALNEGHVWRGEIVNRRKNGETYLEEMTITPVSTNGLPSHYVAIKRDLSDKRRLEAQFLQAQKMEVVGRLAGGIAHDFNNLLTVINGTAELALNDLPKDHPLRSAFDSIQESGTRAAGLTRQLLTFSRKQIVNRTPLKIADVLTGFRNMLQRLIGEDIALDVRVGASTGLVLADQGQVEQIVLNLAVNARDAMPLGGRLIIEATDVTLDQASARMSVRPGRYVRITVTDTGEGMTEEIKARLFEPFFTTKEAGKGTGLGLATVYAIVDQSGGRIGVESAPGKGTTFTIELPQLGADARVPASAPVPVMKTPPAAGGTILVVEDDESVRELTAAILRSVGYAAVSAGDAAEALPLLKAMPIDLIVTDVFLPGMGGQELAAEAAAIVPDVPVLFTSGHTDAIVSAHGLRERHVRFIAKPFTPQALAAKVREVLAAPGKGMP